MTTQAAANLYLAQHLHRYEGKQWAVHNPHGKRLDELPVIYGFNNGGSAGMLSAVLLAEDGEYLGDHCCSHEGYMPADLGVLEGTRPDRHETFRKHYPDGYRMEFVGYEECKEHEALRKTIAIAEDNYRRSQEVVAEDSAGLDAGPGGGSEAPTPAQKLPETPA